MIRLPLIACALLPLCGFAAELPLIPDPAVRDDPAWSELFARLAPDSPREASFVERRTFPFRKEPVVLTGEIRILPGRGISLDYLTPEARVMIADSKGLLMRDGAGRDLSLPDDPRARGAVTALAGVLRFDLPELEKAFVLRGRRDGDAWTLSLEARDRAVAAALGTIVLTGEQSRLLRIEMNRSASQRVVIDIGGVREDAAFTPADVSRFFR